MDRLTENEKIVLQAYIKVEFCDSGVGSTFWTDAFPDNLQDKRIKARTRSEALS